MKGRGVLAKPPPSCEGTHAAWEEEAHVDGNRGPHPKPTPHSEGYWEPKPQTSLGMTAAHALTATS